MTETNDNDKGEMRVLTYEYSIKGDGEGVPVKGGATPCICGQCETGNEEPRNVHREEVYIEALRVLDMLSLNSAMSLVMIMRKEALIATMPPSLRALMSSLDSLGGADSNPLGALLGIIGNAKDNVEENAEADNVEENADNETDSNEESQENDEGGSYEGFFTDSSGGSS